MAVRVMKDDHLHQDWPEDEDEAERRGRADDAMLDIEDEADLEDCLTLGNGTPCKFYNHGGCRHGQQCRFMHAPDSKSVRDELYVSCSTTESAVAVVFDSLTRPLYQQRPERLHLLAARRVPLRRALRVRS